MVRVHLSRPGLVSSISGGMEDGLDREAMLMPLFSRPSFEVSGEGDKGEGPSMFYSQPPFVIRNLNSLFLFTIVQCALQLEQPLYV